MAARRSHVWVVLLSIAVIHFRLYSAEIKKHTLNDVINATSKIINYFKQNYQTLSFDGHFGVRVVEGQLKLLLAEYEKGYHRTIPATLMTQLRQLAEEAAKVGNMAVPHLLDQDPRTFNIVRYQVQNPWMMFHSHRMTDASQRWESSAFQHLKDISEEDRDKCVAELTGATSKSNKKCSVSAECLRLMLSFGRHGYSLQQQIIYVAFVEKVGCSSAIDDFLRSEGGGVDMTMDRVQQVFCSNAYYELSKNIFLYGLQPSFTDLFIQAQFTCPNLGFLEFLQHDWLKLILSWQNESGCYTLGVGRAVKEKEPPHANQSVYIGPKANDGGQLNGNLAVAPEVIGLVRHMPLGTYGSRQVQTNNQNYFRYPQQVANQNIHYPQQVANQNIRYPQQVANQNIRYPQQVANQNIRYPQQVANQNIRYPQQVANQNIRYPQQVANQNIRYPQQVANQNNVAHLNVDDHNYIPHELLQPQAAHFGNIPIHNFAMPQKNSSTLHLQVANLNKTSQQVQEVGNLQLGNNKNIPLQPQVANLEIVPEHIQGINYNYDKHQLQRDSHDFAHQPHAAIRDDPLLVPQIHYRHSNYVDNGAAQSVNKDVFNQNKFDENYIPQPVMQHQFIPESAKDGQQRVSFHGIQNEDNANNLHRMDVTEQPYNLFLNSGAAAASKVHLPSDSDLPKKHSQKETGHAERRSVNLNRGEFANQWHRVGDHSMLKGQSRLHEAGHSHALLPVAAHEIAHGITSNLNEKYSMDQHNSVQEYIHGGIDQIPANILQEQQQQASYPLQHEAYERVDHIAPDGHHNDYQESPHQMQFARESWQDSHAGIEHKSHQLPQSWRQPWAQRVLLWSNEIDKGSDDDGYTFNRDKHIGQDSEGNGTKSYLYYYPMYDQMKRMNQMKYNRAEMMKDRQRPSARKLLREKSNKGACHDYMTGLAASALAMYIRFMVDPGPVEFHHLRLNKPDGNYDVGLENAAIDDDEPEEPHIGYHADRGGVISATRQVAASPLAVNNAQHSKGNNVYKPSMRFKPLYMGEVRKKLHPEESEDFVHAADTYKELVDRAFIHNSQEGIQSIVSSANLMQIKSHSNVQQAEKKIPVLEFPDIEYIGNTPSRRSVVDSIQLSNFQLHLQKELVYHMVIIVAISLLCVFVLFKYLRHKKFSSRHRTKFV